MRTVSPRRADRTVSVGIVAGSPDSMQSAVFRTIGGYRCHPVWLNRCCATESVCSGLTGGMPLGAALVLLSWYSPPSPKSS